MVRVVALGACAVFFAGMGALALARPRRIVGIFGGRADTPASRSEVRAVYGGFGIAVALALACAALQPADPFLDGVVAAIAVSAFGMAGGRLVGLAVERAQDLAVTVLFVAVEVALGGALLVASRVIP
jgi:hypothetical protein